MNRILTLALLALTLAAYPQDTLKIMHYNLLNYGVYYGDYCTIISNDHEKKDGYLRTIIANELPDIFTVNEISNLDYYLDRILDEVMNAHGRDYYRRAEISNIAGSDIVNMLYYNAEKLVLKSQEVTQSTLRDIDLFTLYAKTPALEQGDTIFLNCIVAHLKAGNNASDEDTRAEMTSNLMNYLNNNKIPGNYLVMGDFNTYTSAEECYQNLIDLSANGFRFFDPLNKAGNWSANSTFAGIHTQSVTTISNGCQASGGMDDRFDHILATAQLINGTRGLKYIPESYHAMGQDGKHYNKSITDFPVNTSVPASVLTALFSNSDHLPVRLDLLLNSGNPGGISQQSLFTGASIYVQNNGLANLVVNSEMNINATVAVISMTGQILLTGVYQLNKGINEIKLDINNLRPGIYLIRLSDSQGQTASIKMVK